MESLDAACFDNNKIPRDGDDSERTPVNAYRFNLVKKFSPAKNTVTSISGNTNERVSGAT
ncbi:MAG: hypothetical protein AAB606_01180 [Patescibacteria group bacterium]